MRIVLVGSVAAGTSVGAKARRNTEDAEIGSLEPRDPAWFARRNNRVAESLRAHGVDHRLGATAAAIEGDPATAVLLDSGERIEGDPVMIQVVDVRSAKDHAKSHVPGSIRLPLGELRARAGELDPTVPTVTYCDKGVSGNAGQNILRCLGFTWVANLSGGNKDYQTHLASPAGRP